MRFKVLAPVALGILMTLSAGRASAAPLLQLDIAGGTYDASTQTIVASSNPFSLYAIAAPQGLPTPASVFAQTFYISAAISPQVFSPADLGYFTVNGQVVSATQDMVFGKPPVEVFEELQGADSGDLPGHGIYPTYFAEFAFQFSPNDRTNTYDTALAAQAPRGSTGPARVANGDAFFHQFVIDTSHLNPNYVVHFDLYTDVARRCGRQEQTLTGSDPQCIDMDVSNFAPFSHDAQSPPVPEPATMLLLGTGLATGAVRRYRNRSRTA